jgi:hypothetical protein
VKLDEKHKNQQATQGEVSKLLEMAASRLASGDYGTALHYVMFAQTLSPPALK